MKKGAPVQVIFTNAICGHLIDHEGQARPARIKLDIPLPDKEERVSIVPVGGSTGVCLSSGLKGGACTHLCWEVEASEGAFADVDGIYRGASRGVMTFRPLIAVQPLSRR